ncbi:MAG: hypothetical protein M1134_01785, partial [Actinobacteria bacterium]|nr:hypothetical protein [Actinomycetota bacterium]
MSVKDCMRLGVRSVLALVLGVGSLLAMTAVTAGPAGATSSLSWSIAASPNQAGSENSLSDVSCVSSTSCIAVGSYSNKTASQTLIESWNGTSWSIAASPNQAGSDSYLSGVSCASSTSCTAVGYFFNYSGTQTLIESWNGTSWSIAASPNQAGSDSYLSGVSCASSTSCTAVGYYNNNGVSQTLIESWNGTIWSIAASPNMSSSQYNSLGGVSCVSSTSCTADGYYSNGTVLQTLFESWNGTSWSIVASPSTSSSQDNLLSGISCVSSTSCTAVGYYYINADAQPLIESWNGTSWSIVASPNPSGSNRSLLFGVSCVGSTSCTAVGSYDSTVNQTLIESWNGTSWSITSSPNPPGTLNNRLYGVSCTSSTSCTAVGYYNDNAVSQTLIESWNGTNWSIAASPNTSFSQDNHLSGASCVGSTSCTAVGYYYNGSVDQTLIESWNGTSWSIAADPNAFFWQGSYLSSVSCTSSTSCTAVGYYNNNGVSQTLIESWNGTSWSIATSPGGPGSELSGVSCTSSTSCTAVGSSGSETLIESWNGTSWSIASSPYVPGSLNNYLNGVSCTSSTSCTAVGNYYNYHNNTVAQTLIESWNGTSWSVPASPNTSSSENNLLTSVSCVSSVSCTAVGFDYYYYNYNNYTVDQTLIEVETPGPSTGYYEAASDGGIFSFGPGATFYGSMGGKALNSPSATSATPA